MKWSNCSFKSLEEKLKEKPYVVLPVGTIEPHGPHLPLNTDAYIAEKLAEATAAKLGLVVSPTLIGGAALKGFPGSLGYGKTSKTVFKKTCEQMLKHVKKVYLVNGCGGNSEAVEYVIKKFPDRVIALPVWWRIKELFELDESRKDFIAAGNEAEDWCGTHAGEIETSLMLALNESLVNKEKIQDAYGPQSRKYMNQKLQVEKLPLYKVIPKAILGDARKASKEKGEKMLDIIVNEYVRFIQDEIKTFK